MPSGVRGAADVLLVASVLPYTRATIELAEYARASGVPIVAVTDSEVAPLAQIAEAIIIVPTESPSFLHAMTPAFAIAEVLGALVAGRGGEAALQALKRFDGQLAALDTHLQTRNSKRAS